jgi:hypothetical protein
MPAASIAPLATNGVNVFFITIVDRNLITIGNQVGGKIAAHMTEADHADAPNRRLRVRSSSVVR